MLSSIRTAGQAGPSPDPGRRRGRLGRLGVVVATLTAAALVGSGVTAALADEPGVPTQAEVDAAESAAAAGARDVATVQAELAVANQTLQKAAIAAAQAAEAFNGARVRLQEARRAERAALERQDVARADVDRQGKAYANALATSYQLAPQLRATAAIVNADGIESVIEQTYTLANAESALDRQYATYRAAETLAQVASDQAGQARDEAARAQTEARQARDRAAAAEQSAQAQASEIAARKDALIGELAQLQGISTRLAARRQAALEAQAQAAAAEAAQAAQEQSEPSGGTPAAGSGDDAGAAPGGDEGSDGGVDPGESGSEEPAEPPAPAPTPAPPAPSGGASAAISFARQQLGEPYRWGAAGPSAWDCSGLTMAAWRAGGKSLPHWSVGQYSAATPIGSSQLRPGDLVFWGSSRSPSSIYHVALYIGGGQIIHAPRTGRPVSQESMYYWIPPTFFARP